MSADAVHDQPELQQRMAQWAQIWELAGLERRLDVTFSRRFQTSLGRCNPRTGEIRLAAFLLTGPRALLHETLCHEAAHAAVFELHGRGPKPHGEEWRRLMRAAGFEPRARVPASSLPELPIRRRRRARPSESRYARSSSPRAGLSALERMLRRKLARVLGGPAV